MTILLAIAGFMRSGIGSLLGGLRQLNAMQLLALALALALAIDHVALVVSHRHTAKMETQLTASAGALKTCEAGQVTLKQAIADQNAAVKKLASASKAQQVQAARALAGAQERISEAEGAAQRLRAQSLPAAGKSNRSGICEPDAAAKELWP